MEVVPPLNSTDNFYSSPAYAIAPSTPKLMADNLTAPTSPARISQLFDELFISDATQRSNSPVTVPFAWEETPGVPKSTSTILDVDFAFDVSGEFPPDSAEDLFHGGMIKPVEIEPPSATLQHKNKEKERGRERNSSGLPSSRSRRTRSLPPFRGVEQPPAPANTTPLTSSCSTLSTSSSGKGSKKWSFKNLFLFRSASDGRALDRDPLKKYSTIFRKHDEDLRNSSLRHRSGSGSGSGSKRRGRVSAHELHYTVNRAVSNDMKRKTFLPYKQGILGRLAFNPTVHALSNGFGFSHNH